MKLNALLVVSALVYAVFGIAFVLAAGTVITLYTGMPMAGLTTQLLGATLLGFAGMNMFARNAGEGPALQAIVVANLISDAIGFVLTLIGQVSGMANVLGWSTVAIYLVFALGFAYYLFLKPGGVDEHAPVSSR